MKKLLLLIGLIFPQATRPISRLEGVQWGVGVAGIITAAYVLKQYMTLDEQIRKINILLKNHAHQPDELTKLTRIKKQLEAQIKMYESVSYAAVFIGFKCLEAAVMSHNARLDAHAQQQATMWQLMQQEEITEDRAWHAHQPLLAAELRHHQETIRQSRTTRQQQRTTRAQAPAAATQECPQCAEEFIPNDYITMACGHRHCADCLDGMIALTLREQTSRYIQCPTPGCRRNFAPEDIALITHHHALTITAVAAIIQQEQINAHPDRRQCRTLNCSHTFINNGNNAHTMQCPVCNKRYCSNCLYKHPETVPCQDAQHLRQTQADNTANATNKWFAEHTQPCPRCSSRIERGGGCLHVVCTKCFYDFCWNCHRKHHVWECNNPAVNPRVKTRTQT